MWPVVNFLGGCLSRIHFSFISKGLSLLLPNLAQYHLKALHCASIEHSAFLQLGASPLNRNYSSIDFPCILIYIKIGQCFINLCHLSIQRRAWHLLGSHYALWNEWTERSYKQLMKQGSSKWKCNICGKLSFCPPFIFWFTCIKAISALLKS